MGSASKFRRRAPWWARADVKVSSGETFKVRITCPQKMDILGFRFEGLPHERGGADIPR